MRILVNGAAGHMGRVLCGCIESGASGAELAGAVDFNPAEGMYAALDDFTGAADCIIDFSHHAATRALTDYAVRRGLPTVIATTGQTPEETELTDETLEGRVGMLAQAVETAAARLLQERAGGMRPGCGEAAPLSAQMICRTPVARLAEMMGEEG